MKSKFDWDLIKSHLRSSPPDWLKIAELQHASVRKQALQAGLECELKTELKGSGLYSVYVRLPQPTVTPSGSLLNLTSPAALQGIIDLAKKRLAEAEAKLAENKEEAYYLRREINTQLEVINARTADLKAIQP